MSAKYSGLPDIDSSSVDIYESNDVIQSFTTPTSTSNITTRNENISEDNLSISNAKDKFSTKEVYTSDDIDFSTKIGSIKSSYKTKSINETLEMKIIRLKREVTEAQLEIEREGSSKDTKEEMKSLEDILNKLRINNEVNDKLKLYNPATDEPESTVATPTTTTIRTTTVPTSTITNYIQRIADLEARLTSLEDKIGNPTSSKPILISVDDIKRKVSLFTNDPNSTQKATNNLKEIISLVDKIKSQSTPSRTISSTNTDTLTSTSTAADSTISLTTELKVNSLYNQLSLLDTYSSIIPRILSRLQSLQGLHNDSSDSISRLKDIDNTISLITTELTQWKQSINSLQTKLTNYDSKSDQNRQELQKWLTSIKP